MIPTPAAATAPHPEAATDDPGLRRLTRLATDLLRATGHCYPSELFAVGADPHDIARCYPTAITRAQQRLAEGRAA